MEYIQYVEKLLVHPRLTKNFILKIPMRMKLVVFLILAIFALTCNGCNGHQNVNRAGMEYIQYVHRKDAPTTILVYNGYQNLGEIAHVTLSFKGGKKIKELSERDDILTTVEYDLPPGDFKWTELESRTLIGIDVTFSNNDIGYCSNLVNEKEAHVYHIYPNDDSAT